LTTTQNPDFLTADFIDFTDVRQKFSTRFRKGRIQSTFGKAMIVPQPFQYQGSKRALAPLILQYLPVNTTRLVEPFCGSAALSIATAVAGWPRNSG
jgi:hypothetical protein